MATQLMDRADLYGRVTAQVIETLERGARPWLKPWNANGAGGAISRPLRHNGEAYRGINVLLLWSAAAEQGFSGPYWLTFKQAQSLGGYVRKGERGVKVVYANSIKKSETAADGAEIERDVFFLRQYCVFNADQCQGLPRHFYNRSEPLKIVGRIERAESFVGHTSADVRYGGDLAYYAPHTDYIGMPPRDAFRDGESLAATLAHELVHWTSHPSRLNRDLGKTWGDEDYAKEELIAELGAAFLCADLNITPEVREDHAGYIDSWLGVLRGDKRAIFRAASHAARAVEFLHGLQPEASRPSHAT